MCRLSHVKDLSDNGSSELSIPDDCNETVGLERRLMERNEERKRTTCGGKNDVEGDGGMTSCNEQPNHFTQRSSEKDEACKYLFILKD